MVSITHVLASISAERPDAAAIDHISEPVVTPDASANPNRRPMFIDVPAMAMVAGPGVPDAISAAPRISHKLTCSSTSAAERGLDSLQRIGGLGAIRAAGLRHVGPPAPALAAQRLGALLDEVDRVE